MGVVGAGIASFITNTKVLALNLYLTSIQEDLEAVNAVPLSNPQVWTDFGTYLRIGLPNLMIILLDWTCFEISSLFAGLLGVNE